MSARFEELDWQQTPMGAISLRRRRDPGSGEDVYEVKLDDDFLMSSLFTVAEVAVARLALAALPEAALPEAALPEAQLDVCVGGLGLGYTAVEVLDHPGVRSLVVVERLTQVIGWHQNGLIPAGVRLRDDDRCRLVEGDFFAMAAGSGFDPAAAGRRFHAIVVDIDHSPRHLLHPSHADFYGSSGTRQLAERLHVGGVFALWSNDPPDDAYTAVLGGVFDHVQVEVVSFPNVLQGRESSNTVYVARLD